MNEEPIQIKIIMLGDLGVGKSSIVVRFVTGNFQSNGEATIGSSYMSKILQFIDKTIKFNIWDTAGQEQYHSLSKMYYRDANVAIIVYDITKKESFEGLKKWQKELADFGPNNISTIIVGNKKDLVESEVVNPEEAKNYADSIGAVYKKISAKTDYGVEQIFRELAEKFPPEIDVGIPSRIDTVQVNKIDYEKSNGKKKCC
ncbi:hypothetical protein SteCoe_16802 [Stentor coeruleus]|uniref:Uncharacterized protein n=1 Tax=Stentor coeruleus TaxID=5963 RepID=A0A1R2C0G3_9CILI|nr:hypothetical protein SteCoe_16802 [Stentor coeruleus]